MIFEGGREDLEEAVAAKDAKVGLSIAAVLAFLALIWTVLA